MFVSLFVIVCSMQLLSVLIFVCVRVFVFFLFFSRGLCVVSCLFIVFCLLCVVRRRARCLSWVVPCLLFSGCCCLFGAWCLVFDVFGVRCVLLVVVCCVIVFCLTSCGLCFVAVACFCCLWCA